MKQYFVIFSKDPYLLARLCTELEMCGENIDKAWGELHDSHPFNNLSDGQEFETPCNYLAFHVDDGWGFYNHDCSTFGNKLERLDIQINLTEENYLSVLTKIIEQ